MTTHAEVAHSELGKKTVYEAQYDANKLFPIPRKFKRKEIGIADNSPLPFFGFDIWNHYEGSWLNEKGKPVVAIAEIIYGFDSENIIESKSMKLYFNSLNNTKFKDENEVAEIITRDLQERLNGGFLQVNIILVSQFEERKLRNRLEGICIDDLDVECSEYHVNPEYLMTDEEMFVDEVLYSDLLKSNCLVTNQPDWCSVQIDYRGKKIDQEGLLRYLVSFRNDNEFHEQCIEKIFMHIMQYCKPEELTVYGRSTRRGGLDINSYRSTEPVAYDALMNVRLCRQ